MTVQIVDMTLAHLDAVSELEARTYPVPWSTHEFRKEITENKFSICKTALIEAQVAGFAVMWHVVNEGQICNIAVDENFRRRGVASRLIEALIAEAQAREMLGLTLEVRMGNAAAQKLYFKYGFKIEGLRKNYYTYPTEDGVVMWKYF